jgi:chemosensory pili system protein ChpA (sensor histidine kinase/response regulator)
MQSEQHQRIVHYFIEESQEHLGTIRQGLDNLKSAIADPETTHEMYRAAHSVKGGAAMLGFGSIQQVAYRLEDCFKLLKDRPAPPDLLLETLFFQAFDSLQELLDQLQAPYGLTEENASRIMSSAEPVLAQLWEHVQQLANQFAPSSLSNEWDAELPEVELPITDAIDLGIGDTELSSLADLFSENASEPELDLSWQEESDLDELLESAATSVGLSDLELDLPGSQMILTEPSVAAIDDFQPTELENLAPLGEDDNLDNLEAFLDSAQPVGVAAPETTPLTSSELPDNFDVDELENLLGSESSGVDIASLTPISSPIPPKGSADDDFSDLDRLLDDANTKLEGALSPSKPKIRTPVPPVRQPVGPKPKAADQTMRVPVKQLDGLNNLVGELVVNRNSLEQDQERLRQFLDNLLYQAQQLSDVGQRMQDLYERSLLENSLLAARQSSGRVAMVSAPLQAGFRSSGSPTSTMDVGFDALEMDRFSGFHLLAQEMIEFIVRIREAASDVEFVVDEADQVTRMLRQITSQLQEGVTRSRMMPFAQIADRLPRAVRDIAIKVGKQAELVVEGRETMIDKMILEQLYDPMTHLVNNAIAHGIEDPEVRQARGKSPTGRITIRTYYQGNQTVISVSDDGAGIDPERVKAKALEKGLITPSQAASLSRLDIYDLLFLPGFSTKDQADDFAGRGVGMDVVKTSLNEIRGDIVTDSSLGEGTTFTIRLPLTLSISKALCCVSDRGRIAFPMDGVEDILDIPKEEITVDAQGQSCVQWRDTLLPFRPLSELLRYSRHLGRGTVYGSTEDEEMTSIVVLRGGSNVLALQVDQVLGEQEIVIKQLEGPAPKPLGVAGATVQGDGRVMPIADVLELIDLATGRIREATSMVWDQVPAAPEPVAAKTEPMVLIVDDSITVRELLSMTFNKVGYRVEQARDGQEAWEKLRAGLPCDLVFCDIEMPRMDGLELLSRIHKDPNLSHLPVAMLTSRGADRHRQLAADLGASGYFTKPYLEEALLDAAQRMLKGETLLKTKAAGKN